jgi:hypothetical protein
MQILGLGLLLLAWLYQAYYASKGALKLKAFFLMAYGLGVLLLVIDAFRLAAYVPAWFNLALLPLIALIFWQVWLKRREA